MPAIKNLEGLTTEQINRELDHGARFVIYEYAVSIVVMTFKRSSDIYFVRAGENGMVKGLPFTFISFFFGWWGIPSGSAELCQYCRTASTSLIPHKLLTAL
jgi:hypothetical protein